MRKVYVQVAAIFSESGRIVPRSLVFEDGERYTIDRILDVRPAASLKVGGIGIRYRVRVGNHETHLFLEDNRWFVEAKDSV